MKTVLGQPFIIFVRQLMFWILIVIRSPERGLGVHRLASPGHCLDECPFSVVKPVDQDVKDALSRVQIGSSTVPGT